MDLGPLPWTAAQIEAVLPHRTPFLFVDRVTELVPEKSIAGQRTWSQTEAVLRPRPGGGAFVPAPYLAECMAQVGAILILSRPENRGRLIYFVSIDRARFKRPVASGETTRVEARVLRLRSRMGTLAGRALVDGNVVAEGAMTFALGAEAGA